MKQTMTSPVSISTARETLQRLFSPANGADKVTFDQICSTYERAKGEQTRKWLANKLTPLRFYGFIRSVYVVEGGIKRTTGIQLTEAGKAAMAIHEPVRTLPPKNDLSAMKDLSLGQFISAVADWMDEHPEFDITFEYRQRGKPLAANNQ